MNKIYILVPVLCVAVFAGIYWNFDKGYEAKLEARRVAEQQVLKEKQLRDQAARELAYKSAIEAADKRKAERAEKERIEEAKKKARQEADDRRQRNFEERKRLREQSDRLRKDVDIVKADIAKLEEEKKRHIDELSFLQGYVKKAEANQKQYYDLYGKIEAADAAKIEAERLAKAAAAAAKG